jgi:hypothetical protein
MPHCLLMNTCSMQRHRRVKTTAFRPIKYYFVQIPWNQCIIVCLDCHDSTACHRSSWTNSWISLYPKSRTSKSLGNKGWVKWVPKVIYFRNEFPTKANPKCCRLTSISRSAISNRNDHPDHKPNRDIWNSLAFCWCFFFFLFFPWHFYR